MCYFVLANQFIKFLYTSLFLLNQKIFYSSFNKMELLKCYRSVLGPGVDGGGGSLPTVEQNGRFWKILILQSHEQLKLENVSQKAKKINQL